MKFCVQVRANQRHSVELHECRQCGISVWSTESQDRSCFPASLMCLWNMLDTLCTVQNDYFKGFWVKLVNNSFSLSKRNHSQKQRTPWLWQCLNIWSYRFQLLPGLNASIVYLHVLLHIWQGYLTFSYYFIQSSIGSEVSIQVHGWWVLLSVWMIMFASPCHDSQSYWSMVFLFVLLHSDGLLETVLNISRHKVLQRRYLALEYRA